MIRDVLGILADFVGIVFVWWQPASLAWYLKLIISVSLAGVAIAFFILTRKRPIEKVRDYSWEDNKPMMLFLDKNTYYSNGMLVSIYAKEGRETKLCAVGHVNMDPEEKKVHIQVLHEIDANAIAKIRNSPREYKRFFVKPSVTQNTIVGINWK